MEPYRTTMKVIIQKIGYDYGIDIVELEFPEDHNHMVVRSAPKLSTSNVTQVIKAITAREFFRIYPEIKKNYPWGAYSHASRSPNTAVFHGITHLGLKIMVLKLFCRNNWSWE